MTSHSFRGLFSLHSDVHTISYKCLYMGISWEAVRIALNSIMLALRIYNAIALFTCQKIDLIFISIPSSEFCPNKNMSQLSSLLSHKQSLNADFPQLPRIIGSLGL